VFFILTVSGMAQAANISFSFSGTVSGVSTQTYGTSIPTTYGTGDALGVFGGGDLTGQSFTMSVTYDPAALTADYPAGYSNQPSGGGANNGWQNNTPAHDGSLSYSLTVNNTTSTTTNNVPDGNGITYLTNFDLSYNGPTPFSDANAYLGGQNYASGYADKTNTSFLIYSDTPFSDGVTDPSGNMIEDQAYMTAFANNLCINNNAGGNCRFFVDQFTVTDTGWVDTSEVITLTGTSPAPEPGTWISLGIGLCGVALFKGRAIKLRRA
jgi:hypothetical protein